MAEGAPVALETEYPWRQGRSVGRTVYMQISGEPTDVDVLIGVMDSAEIAERVVRAHNYCLVRKVEP